MKGLSALKKVANVILLATGSTREPLAAVVYQNVAVGIYICKPVLEHVNLEIPAKYSALRIVGKKQGYSLHQLYIWLWHSSAEHDDVDSVSQQQ